MERISSEELAASHMNNFPFDAMCEVLAFLPFHAARRIVPRVCRAWHDMLQDDGRWAGKLLELFAIPDQYGELVENTCTEFGHNGASMYFLMRALCHYVTVGPLMASCGGKRAYGMRSSQENPAPCWHWQHVVLKRLDVYHGYCDARQEYLCLGAEFDRNIYSMEGASEEHARNHLVQVPSAGTAGSAELTCAIDEVMVFPCVQNNSGTIPSLVSGMKPLSMLAEAEKRRVVLITIANLLIAEGLYQVPQHAKLTKIPYAKLLPYVLDIDAIRVIVRSKAMDARGSRVLSAKNV